MRSPLTHMLRPALLATGLAACLAGCAGLSVDTDYDPATDFTAYTSFAVMDAAAAPEVPDLVQQRIHAAVRAELAAKGLTEVAEEDAALLVAHDVSVEQRVRKKDPYYAFDEVELYELKTLTIDLVDAATRDLVWRGLASSDKPAAKTPEEREERIREAVREILERYPPAK